MKKGAYTFFLILGIFLGVLCGMLIGRRSNAAYVIQRGNAAFEESIDTTDAPIVSDGKININTASVSLLQTLPDIGQVLAQRIVDYREENGNFTVIEDLMQIKGIGEKRIEQLRQYITVGG